MKKSDELRLRITVAILNNFLYQSQVLPDAPTNEWNRVMQHIFQKSTITDKIILTYSVMLQSPRGHSSVRTYPHNKAKHPWLGCPWSTLSWFLLVGRQSHASTRRIASSEFLLTFLLAIILPLGGPKIGLMREPVGCNQEFPWISEQLSASQCRYSKTHWILNL